MKQGVFINGNLSRGDTRDILIKVNDEFIEFFFYDDYLRQRAYVQGEQERRVLYNEEPLTKDESDNHGFYWIDSGDWISDRTKRLDREDNWGIHMSHKAWFTQEMKDFIDKSLDIKNN